MKITFQTVSIFFFIFLVHGHSSGAPADLSPAVWDTVVAKMQVIESARQPDSVKVILVIALLQKYNITQEEYAKFYENIFKLSPDEQAAFLKRVEKVISGLLKEESVPPTTPPRKTPQKKQKKDKIKFPPG